MKYIRPIIVIAIIIIAWTALYYFDKVYSSSSEWLAGVEICTDIWQNTYNETQYYACMNPLDREAYGTETNPPPSSTVNEYIKEIKFQTCHVNFDIYNLSSYYRCIEL
jgi:hypothetical protein